MIAYIEIFFVTVGTFFMFLGALGIVRMPDLFTRMHASTKAASLGVGMILIGSALHFGELGVATKAIITTVFIFLTAPVAAHMIGRAAFVLNIPRWEGTVIDEAEGNFDDDNSKLLSPPEDGSTRKVEPRPKYHDPQ